MLKIVIYVDKVLLSSVILLSEIQDRRDLNKMIMNNDLVFRIKMQNIRFHGLPCILFTSS